LRFRIAFFRAQRSTMLLSIGAPGCLRKMSASASDSINRRSLCPVRNSVPSYAPPTASPSTREALSSTAHCAPDGSAAGTTSTTCRLPRARQFACALSDAPRRLTEPNRVGYPVVTHTPRKLTRALHSSFAVSQSFLGHASSKYSFLLKLNKLQHKRSICPLIYLDRRAIVGIEVGKSQRIKEQSRLIAPNWLCWSGNRQTKDPTPNLALLAKICW
jgi:hypothetical protein